ncbi:hypothetical protein M6B38_268960 [Iris pallida]|uniref:Uncharacterized protein n=1 Tax=Iris pallida TaxID=29817 RepID=A0AAX6I9L4_IRIPA|nr:hypothetical protein M6B38_268960 [Iris pallida]
MLESRASLSRILVQYINWNSQGQDFLVDSSISVCLHSYFDS